MASWGGEDEPLSGQIAQADEDVAAKYRERARYKIRYLESHPARKRSSQSRAAKSPEGDTLGRPPDQIITIQQASRKGAHAKPGNGKPSPQEAKADAKSKHLERAEAKLVRLPEIFYLL